MNTGILYIVATPIGNMQDITVRAAKLLLQAKTIACEDTRRAGLFLQELRKEYLERPEEAQKPHLISFYEQNEEQKIPQIIEILKSGQDVALISDAGTPSISDPGFTVVREAIKNDIKVEGLPGASSVTLALTVSGLPTDKFTFVGYLPAKEGNAKKMLENIKKSQESLLTTVIFFEAPHKLVKTLHLVEEVLGNMQIVACRELTKVHEEVIRCSISELIQKYATQEPKGEFVLLFHF